MLIHAISKESYCMLLHLALDPPNEGRASSAALEGDCTVSVEEGMGVSASGFPIDVLYSYI
jgi:hypothetical protein